MSTEENNNALKNMTFNDFLEKNPPNVLVNVTPFKVSNYGNNKVFKLPIIELYCNSDFCEGYRFFESESTMYLSTEKRNNEFIEYRCKNCHQSTKTYAIVLEIVADKNEAISIKLGEFPAFGPPTPSKLSELIGPDKNFFLLGRKCELQGLGIGAFVYYRRVIENQKDRIFDRVIQVTRKINSNPELIIELENAKKETQFSKAVDSIKHAMPEILLIDNHSPLKLLHDALSDGVHDKSDEECLDLAQSIRIVLSEFSNRLAQALNDEAELKKALSKLMNRKK